MDVVLALLFLFFLEVFELNNHTDNPEQNHEGKVEIEPASDGINSTWFDFLDKTPFVGVRSGNKERNTTDEHITTGKCSDSNNNLEVAAESQSCASEGTSDVDDPEEPFLWGQPNDGCVKNKSNQETTPSGDEGSTEFLALEK